MIIESTYGEAVVRILNELDSTDMDYDRDILLNVLDKVLGDYDIKPRQNALTTSDMSEKIMYFLACKKQEGLSKGTLKTYMYMLRKFSRYVIKPVQYITVEDIRMYIHEISKTIKQSSLELVLWALKSFFTWLQREGYIVDNPTMKIKVPKRAESLRKVLTVEELERLRNACKTPRQRCL